VSLNGHSVAAWQQGGLMGGMSSSQVLDCNSAIFTARLRGRTDRGRVAMNELISMLPWALGLVAAAAALTQVR
jgi:hypothetical protein